MLSMSSEDIYIYHANKRLVRSDEYCPHCDNHFVIEAKTPQAALRVEGEDVRVDSRCVLLLLHRF